MHFSSLLVAIVRVALLRSSWHSCLMRAALFIMRATNSSLVFTFSLYTSLFIHPHRQKFDLYAPTSNSCIFTPTENWTHVYMNLYSRNSPYYHLLKCLLFLLKHPVYTYIHTYTILITSTWIHRMRNVSGKSCLENQNTHFVFNNFFSSSTTGSQGVRISGSNAGYTMFRGSEKSIGHPLHSPVSPSLPLPCVTVCRHISTVL